MVILKNRKLFNTLLLNSDDNSTVLLNFMFVIAKEMLTATKTRNLTALNATRKADTVFI